MIRVVGGAAVEDGRVLMARRGPGSYEGLWEFPGGKVEPGEDEPTALRRELLEELDTEVEVGAHIATGQDEHVELAVYRVRLLGTPRAVEHSEIAWIPLSELRNLPVPPADVATVHALLSGG